jgi:hypothetical protein
MNTEKLIIFALLAFVVYNIFLKEGFQPQKTNCSVYPLENLCQNAKNRGCIINKNRTESNPDLCICNDPEKCQINIKKTKSQSKTDILNRMLKIQDARLNPILNAYNNFDAAYTDWNNTTDKEGKELKWDKVLKTYYDYLAVKPGAAEGGLPNDPDVIILNQGVQKDGTFKFAGSTGSLFQLLGNEYKDLYTKYEMMLRQGM